MKLYGYVLTAVTEFLAAIVMFFFIGQYTDKYFQTQSRYTAIGAVSGTIFGFVLLVKRLQSAMAKDDEDKH